MTTFQHSHERTICRALYLAHASSWFFLSSHGQSVQLRAIPIVWLYSYMPVLVLYTRAGSLIRTRERECRELNRTDVLLPTSGWRLNTPRYTSQLLWLNIQITFACKAHVRVTVVDPRFSDVEIVQGYRLFASTRSQPASFAGRCTDWRCRTT